jgi:hypothetical protein
VHRIGNVSLRIYADDYRPPHFHIVAVDFLVLVRISDLAVIAGQARPAQIAQAFRPGLGLGAGASGNARPSLGGP